MKSGLLTLSSFFKHLLPILFQIVNRLISKTQRPSLKIMSGFSHKREFILTTMFLQSDASLKHNSLPNQSFIQLNDEEISDSDYQHALNVWNAFNCKTIRDNRDLYLKSDVLVLVDVFENFRKTCLKH